MRGQEIYMLELRNLCIPTQPGKRRGKITLPQMAVTGVANRDWRVARVVHQWLAHARRASVLACSSIEQARTLALRASGETTVNRSRWVLTPSLRSRAGAR